MRLIVFAFSLIISQITLAQSVVWNKKPIQVQLPVNQEKLIVFNESVEVGFDKQQLPDSMLSIDNVSGTLYLTAHQEVNRKQRFYIKLKSGEMILLDVVANSIGSPETLTIEQPVAETKKIAQSHDVEEYANIFRFALQSVYYPERVRVANQFSRAPMQTTQLVPLVTQHKVFAMPLAQWRKGDYFVTAVIVRNRTNHSQQISLKDLNGQWVAMSMYPSKLLERQGHANDCSALFLISKTPFREALAAA